MTFCGTKFIFLQSVHLKNLISVFYKEIEWYKLNICKILGYEKSSRLKLRNKGFLIDYIQFLISSGLSKIKLIDFFHFYNF
jgi:hypothetical protein